MALSNTDVIAAENELLKAIETSNLILLDKLLVDDLLFLAPDGQTITKSQDLASHRAGSMVVESLIPTIEMVNIVDDIAIVTTSIITKGKMLGQSIEGRFRYIRVWKLFNSQLKVIAGSCIKIHL